MRRITHWLCTALLTCLAAGAQAQKIEGPVKIVVGYPPGGITDRAARIVGDGLQTRLGVPVIVENKPGAGSRLAAQQVKNTPASQNVLLFANPPSMVTGPLIYKDSGYDPERDFQTVSVVNHYELAIAVGAAVPVKALTHLLAWMRANPDKANVGVPATGSLVHFFALMLGEKAGVQTEVVGYRGSGPLLTDLIGGQVPVVMDSLDILLPQHQAGKIRILAVSSPKRSPFSPDIPTFREAGVDLAAEPWNALFAPASMPKDKVERLGKEVAEMMKDPAIQSKFTAARVNTLSTTPAQANAIVQSFRQQWRPVVLRANIQP